MINVNPDGTCTAIDDDGVGATITLLPPEFTLCPWQIKVLHAALNGEWVADPR